MFKPALSRAAVIFGIRRVGVSIAFVLAAFTLNDAMHRGQHADTLQGLVTGAIPQAPLAPCPAAYISYFGPAQSWQLVLAVLSAAPLALRRRYPTGVDDPREINHDEAELSRPFRC